MKTQKQILSWLRANFGKRCCAALTSSDTHALIASVNLSNLISYSSAPKELFHAYGSIVRAMQPHTRWLAYHAIACELDWGHRVMIWSNAMLSFSDVPMILASFEPGGIGRDLTKEAA